MISLEEAKLHLRIDTDAEDSDLMLKIKASEAAVLHYMKREPYQPSEEVPYDVRAAVLILLGYLYEHRDNNEGNAFERGYLPMPVTALLTPYRIPTLG